MLVGEETWRLVRHAVRLEPVPPLALKGKSGPVRAWRLVALSPGQDPDPPVEARWWVGPVSWRGCAACSMRPAENAPAGW
jgi:hypothetical protein